MSTIRRSTRVAAMNDAIEMTGVNELEAGPVVKRGKVKKAKKANVTKPIAKDTKKKATVEKKAAKTPKRNNKKVEAEVIEIEGDDDEDAEEEEEKEEEEVVEVEEKKVKEPVKEPVKEKKTKEKKVSNSAIKNMISEKTTPKRVRKKIDLVEDEEPARKKASRSKQRDTVVLDDDEEEVKEVSEASPSIEELSEDDEDDDEDEELKELEVGDAIPKDIVLTLQDSKTINLRDFAKKAGKLIIFAYPKASTPGCTRQANGFKEEYDELKGLKSEVLGLSSDNENAQTKFKSRHELPFDLICDVKRQLITLLGCPKSAVSGTIRSHFIFIDGILKVKKVKISPEDSFNKALEYIKNL